MSLDPLEPWSRLNMRLDLPGTRRTSVAALRGTAAALLLLVATSVAAADFDAGVRAFNRGDYASAFREFRALAEQGYALAQSYLGFMYANGEGVPEDDRQAAFWFRKAAEQGHASAQNDLGGMYAEGEGVAEDFIRAYAWVNLAAATGAKYAKENRQQIRELMTPAQIAKAQALSRTLAARIEGGQRDAALSPPPDNPARPAGPSRDLVFEVQTYLARLGYDPGPLDGLPGRRTTEAVRRFQRDFGLAATGWISEELLALLVAVAAAR